jgi:hypothetical protein
MNVIISCGVAGALVRLVPILRGLGHAAQAHVLTLVPDQGQEHGREPDLEPGLQGLALPGPGRHGNDPERGRDRVPGLSLSAGVCSIYYRTPPDLFQKFVERRTILSGKLQETS